MSEEYIVVTVTELVQDEGSVVLFSGTDESGHQLIFGADHRAAQDLATALESGESPVAAIPGWSIWAGGAH